MFPQFNIHSTPLLILVIQGLLFAFLLLNRFRQNGKHADLLIALVLLIMAWHRTTYTIGFMGWYDAFKNTKINYYLLSFALANGPLVYLYLRTIAIAPFKLKKSDVWHFVPIMIYLAYRVVLLGHDMMQEGWDEGYAGEWMQEFDDVYVQALLHIVSYSSMLLYLAFTIQLFLQYRKKIHAFFSNTYQVELHWIRNFLAIYTFLFAYGYLTDFIDGLIVDLDYVHKWWTHFFSAIAIVYLGYKAWTTDLNSLHELTFEMGESACEIENSPLLSEQEKEDVYKKEKERIKRVLENEQAFLDPDFTLKQLAKSTQMNVNEVSAAINGGFGVNFNELINRYRVEAVKEKLLDENCAHLSLVGIAMDCGFNSKATFNRVFKKVTGLSPSQFRDDN